MTEIVKLIPKAEINRIRYMNSYLQYKKYGKSSNIEDYSDLEISEMQHGIYKDTKMIMTDGDYFMQLNDVVEVVCKLKEVSYFKNPTQLDYETNKHNRIENIRTFWVSDYFLITKDEVHGTREHKISNLLHKIGAIRKGSGRFSKLFSIPNDFMIMQPFTQGYAPKDLYFPIQSYINMMIYKMSYRIDNFKVETDIKLISNQL